ncbi:alpha/beta hydrolase [Parafilimonas terrae]|jgi:pimeloyl-ACP methyl ester carboxylesterase|uniref:Pimeloyl-ACP methyl ester carboxylesterase n=1 Tax=Parafilimonas terrae TaxID=1465490 RepID=A0A1I5Y260_9BACT|nr:alpha/beta hydrolase [Parafilimonas terrae]SFQ38067.1 Pimeloyl-ACP methyl ester carboxylesterase [Parafilimonas terrae]
MTKTKLLFATIFLGMVSITAVAQVKNIVLVHGAFADGSGWNKVYSILKDRGYNVSVVGNPNTGMEDDVAATQRVLDRQDGPVILVGHSYGGAIITVAGNSAKVKGLVYVAAFAPDEGETLGKLFGDYPADPINGILPAVNGFAWYDHAKYHSGFCADLSKEESEFMYDSQVPVASSAFTYVFDKNIAWKTKPSWHIISTEDHSIPVALERFMGKRAGGTITEIKASHVVFISHAREVADVIDTAAKSISEK